MGTEYVMTGSIQTRVWDFIRIRHAIRLEQTGIRFGKRSVVHAATDKGYVPRKIVNRGTLILRRQVAIAYMDYVTTLLHHGGFARQFGEEIVTGAVSFLQVEECGCPSYRATEDSQIISGDDVATMCIHEKG